MGASLEAVTTDKLGRRSGPRRKYTIAEKCAMVEETHVHCQATRTRPIRVAAGHTRHRGFDGRAAVNAALEGIDWRRPIRTTEPQLSI
jgi:hypothetical protein